jgi:hypothetical protein
MGDYGVYKISNVINDKLYVGITADIEKRWMQHLYAANSPQQRHEPLYIDMRNYGIDKFKIEVIEKGPDMAYMYRREKYWIQTLSTKRPHGYNTSSGYEWSAYVPKIQDESGDYSIYTYANSLTGEVFALDVDAYGPLKRIKQAERNPVSSPLLAKAMREIWEQGGKVIIRRIYACLEINKASRLRDAWLDAHGKKIGKGRTMLKDI